MTAMPGAFGASSLPNTRLAAALKELGFAASDAATFRSMAQQVGARVDELVVAEVLGVMASTTPSLLPPGQITQDQLLSGPVAAKLAAIANGASALADGGNGWAWKAVLDTLKSMNPNLNWTAIAEQLDHPAFLVPSIEGFYLLAHAFRYGSGEQLPVKAVVGRNWANEVGQLSFLQYAVSVPPDIFSFATSERKLPPVEGLQGGKSPTGTPNQAWLSIDLLQILCHFTVDAAKRSVVLAMLEYPIKHCPEVLLLAMASVPEDTQLLQREVYSVLLPPYLNNSTVNTSQVLHRLWKVNPKLVKEMLVEYFVQGQGQQVDHLPRIHDICRDLQALPELLLDTPSCRFALHLAVYGAQVKQQGGVSLEAWAAARMNREPLMMTYEVIMFLIAKTETSQPAGRGQGRLSEEVVVALLTLLASVRKQLAWDLLDAYRAMAELVVKAYPTNTVKQLLAFPIFTSDVESEAHSLLQLMHTRAKSWDQLVQQLQKLHGSNNSRDRDVFSAFVVQLFGEFPVVPDMSQMQKDWHPSAMLYQALITNQLLPNLSLGIALRIVGTALRYHDTHAIASFGVTVLRQIVRLARPWGAFCEQALLSQTLQSLDLQLYRQVQEAYNQYQLAIRNGEVPSVHLTMLAPLNMMQQNQNPGQDQAANIAATPTKPALPPGMPAAMQAAGNNRAGMNANNPVSLHENDIEGELENNLLGNNALQPAQPAKGPALGVNTVSLENASEKHVQPPENTHDRIHFLINNLSEDSLERHALEIKAKVIPGYIGWFSEYMAKRAAQEPNYHPLYLRLLDRMDDKALQRQLVRSTYYYVRLLMTGDRAVKDSNDRALLKNLGHWLGAFTFKRDKPVLSKELYIKSHVIEAYQQGRLVSVLPFVSNLLSCCEKSRVFTHTNPMIRGLLSLLAELHRLPQLKFNGQYCIEMIFKTFGQVAREWEPTNLLASLPRQAAGNPDFNNILEDKLETQGLISQEAANSMQAMMNAAGGRAFTQQVTGAASVGARTPVKQAVVASSQEGTPGMAGQAPPGIHQPGLAQSIGPGTGNALPNMLANIMGTGMDMNKQDNMMRAGAANAATAAVMGMQQQQQQAAAGQQQAAQQAAQQQQPQAPQPTGLCMEHNALIQYLAQQANINPSLGAIAERLQLKRLVPTAIERGIWDVLNHVVERSVTIACYTTYELLTKDFALDPDETRMRKAAHLMVSSLAGSLSLVTCKDSLRVALTNQLTNLTASLPAAATMDKDTLQGVVTIVVQDNLEACCQVFERAATEKAVRDIDKQLSDKYEERKLAREQKRPFADNTAFHGRFPNQLPDSLRPRPGPVSLAQLRVYEDFARIPRSPQHLMQPGGLPGQVQRPYGMPGEDGNVKEGGFGGQADLPVLIPAILEQQYQSWQTLVDAALSEVEQGNDQAAARLQSHLQELQAFLTAPNIADDVILAVAIRIFRHLMEVSAHGSSMFIKFYITAERNACEALAAKGLSSNLINPYMAIDDERKYGKTVVEELIKSGLLSINELDAYLARLVLVQNPRVLDLVSHLIKKMILTDHVLSSTDLSACLDNLAKVAIEIRNRQPGSQQAAVAEQQLALIEQARRAIPAGLMPNRSLQELPAIVRDKTEPPEEYRQQLIRLLDEWLKITTTNMDLCAYALNPSIHGVSAADKDTLMNFLTSMRNIHLLRDEASIERWVKLCVDLAIDVCNRSLDAVAMGRPIEHPQQTFHPIDGVARLLTCLTVHGCGLPFLKTAMNVIVGIVKRDADERGPAFNGRPHLRLFVMLMTELPGGQPYCTNSEALDTMAMRYLRVIAEALYALQPISVPGWAFCWLTAIANRAFMPRLLASASQHGWAIYEALLVGLLRFLSPHLRASSELSECVRALYKGTLRLLLVLLHDFPEFLCEHHLPLCDAIPVSCVQLRNLVLSAFPRSMRLPDPFTPGLKVDLLPEINQAPRVVPEPEHLLDRHESLRNAIDSYLRNRTPANLPNEIVRAVRLPAPSPDAKGNAAQLQGGSNYNVPLINAIVMYVGVAARGSSGSPADGPPLEIFMRLMQDLDSEGRYLVMNAAANQLRYPNSHTYTFSCILLTLFSEIKIEAVQEQITRVLLERLVVNRPHPWGLLITFIELIKNPRYQFWHHEFTRNGPDVERLFKNVAASCMAHGNAPPAAGAAAEQRKEGEDVRA